MGNFCEFNLRNWTTWSKHSLKLIPWLLPKGIVPTRWHTYETWRWNWWFISSHFWGRRLWWLIFWWLVCWWLYMKCFWPGHSGSSIFCLFSSMTSLFLCSFILKPSIQPRRLGHLRNHQEQMTETYLEPDFHLVLCDVQSNCNFCSFCHWKIFFLVELNLQLVYLIFTEKGFQDSDLRALFCKKLWPIRARVHYWKPTWTLFDDRVFFRAVFLG